jgi:hypothetical protein
MRIGARIEHDADPVPAGLLQFVDQLALVVRLEGRDLEAEFRAKTLACRIHIAQRRRPIGLRLACAEQVQVGTVEDEDAICHRAFTVTFCRGLAVALR